MRSLAALLMAVCMLAAPLTAFAKGDKNFKRGLAYEAASQWEKAAQEFTMAIAAEPQNLEYQLHYRRAVFNASQALMQQGRALAEQKDYPGAYNAFRQAYGYDPVNQLAISEMERMLRLQGKASNGDGTAVETSSATSSASPTGPAATQTASQQDDGTGGTPPSASTAARSGRSAEDVAAIQTRTEPLRVVNYNNVDLKSVVKSLAGELNLNVIFDGQSFRQPRTIDISLRDVTTAQALDWIFLQEGLFFQKLSRRTILVADQTRRPQYQQLVIRTFYLSNVDPNDVRNLIVAAIPPQQGRPQTIVIPDKATNSLTVRDTAENIHLIEDIIQSVDKDRAEVVMDVNIYEVSRQDLLQFGNQIGTDTTLTTLGGTSSLSSILGSREVAQQVFGGATALGAALVVPASVISAFQKKDRTRLLASTQVHAFNGEESSARIGQRVPVQTAQTFPFGNFNNSGTGTGTGGVNQGVGFGGGFPVFQYEPTGLTLKFTPQVFPNLDVQVKMSIESKDVLNAGSPTPTFTERTISGTARIQNNRTMMLASVAQDTQSNGRRGLPLLGLIPVIGRLFTAPTRNNVQTDIVIAVTPRVLRAPAVTPEDEAMRPSGTLQTPTSGSLEALVQEADRDDALAVARAAKVKDAANKRETALAAARNIPTNAVVQLPDAEQPTFVPAPKALMSASTTSAPKDAVTNALATAIPASITSETNPIAKAVASIVNVSSSNSATSHDVAATTTTPAATALSSASETKTTTVAQPQAVEVSAKFKTADAQVATNPSASMLQPVASAAATATTMTREASAASAAAPTGTAELRLMPQQQEMRAGEKRRIALMLTTTEPLGPAAVKLQFDSRFIAIRGISQGDGLTVGGASASPTIMQSIDPNGLVMLMVTPPAGAPLKAGASVMIYLDIEAIAAGDGAIGFDKDNTHLVAADGRGVVLQLVQGRIVVLK
jgi:general secretion pathway protein D